MTSPTEHDGRPRRVVLLVDDDPGDQELTRRAMDRHVGHAELRTVADGEQALDYLERRGAYADRARSPQPDLVLLDLNMPRIDGWQVLERMRSDTSLRAIPVIVLTTSSRPEDIARCYHLGCNSFITKPARLTELDEYLQRIRDFWFETASVPPHD